MHSVKNWQSRVASLHPSSASRFSQTLNIGRSGFFLKTSLTYSIKSLPSKTSLVGRIVGHKLRLEGVERPISPQRRALGGQLPTPMARLFYFTICCRLDARKWFLSGRKSRSGTSLSNLRANFFEVNHHRQYSPAQTRIYTLIFKSSWEDCNRWRRRSAIAICWSKYCMHHYCGSTLLV